MTEVYPVPAEWAANALIDAAGYAEKYRRSIEDPEGFWREEAERIDWIRPFTDGQGHQLRRGRLPHPMVRRRHAQRRRQLPRPAPRRARRHGRDHLGSRDDPGDASRTLTYRELHEEVCRFANALKAEGVGARATG